MRSRLRSGARFVSVIDRPKIAACSRNPRPKIRNPLTANNGWGNVSVMGPSIFLTNTMGSSVYPIPVCHGVGGFVESSGISEKKTRTSAAAPTKSDKSVRPI